MALIDIGVAPGAIHRMLSHIKSGRISASYIFLGKQDRLGFELAIGFAKSLNCERTASDFCDACHSCRMTNAATHPDVKAYDPGGSKFGIGLVRQVQQDSSQSNYSARYRVNILKSSGTMTVEAQNALLKMFEEGRSGCTNIMVSSSLENTLPTIISRSLVLRLPPLPIESSSAILELSGFPPSSAAQEATEANGETMLLSWIAQNKERAEAALSVLCKFGDGPLAPMLSLFDDENDIEFILFLYQQIIRSVLLQKSGIEASSQILKEGIHTLSRFDKTRLEKIRDGVKEIERLWKTQSRKTHLAQTRLLKSWML